MGKLIGTEGKHLRLLQEGEVANLLQMGQSQKYTGGLYHGPTCPGLGHVFTCVQGGWELEREDWRTSPERELLLVVGRRTEGMGGRKSTARNAYGRRPDCHGSRRYCWVTLGGGTTIVASLSPHAGACQWTIKEAPSGLALMHQLLGTRKKQARDGPHTPYARHHKRPSLGPYLLCPWLPASLRIWSCRGSHDPSSHTTSEPCPHWGRSKSSKAASGSDTCGWTTCRGGDKTKAEPQGRGN